MGGRQQMNHRQKTEGLDICGVQPFPQLMSALDDRRCRYCAARSGGRMPLDTTVALVSAPQTGAGPLMLLM